MMGDNQEGKSEEVTKCVWRWKQFHNLKEISKSCKGKKEKKKNNQRERKIKPKKDKQCEWKQLPTTNQATDA